MLTPYLPTCDTLHGNLVSTGECVRFHPGSRGSTYGGWIVLIALGLSLVCNRAIGQSGTSGIDHIRILVRDIAAAQSQYRNVLGFDLSRAAPITYPEGSVHNGAELSDGTYLELIGVGDKDKLLKSRPWIVDFLRSHEGAHSVGMITTSAKEVADRLRSRGIEAPISKLVSSHPGEKPILLVTPKLVNLPEGSIFFVNYPEQEPVRTVVQPNTTQATLAVWIAVKDLEESSREVERLGFPPRRLLDCKSLGVRAREFETGLGKILLLEASSSGPVANFLHERGQGVMGFTLAVSDLAKAQSVIEGRTSIQLQTYDGVYGKSFLVPSNLANGVWIEMVQK
jgi:catechol 2,3-dioxygenase-like lactoylglutathione lyase family enzyme